LDWNENFFLISGDGSSKTSANIKTTAENTDYEINSKSALVNGRLHVFGGSYDPFSVKK
jgi:hypothetical protein